MTSTEANIAEVVLIERGREKSKAAGSRQPLPVGDAGEPFGILPLVDEVICGSDEGEHLFAEDSNRPSRIETILGKAARSHLI